MPLHLDDEFLSSLAYEEVAVALWAIRLHAADEAVTPTIALRLIRQYLQPLIPPSIAICFISSGWRVGTAFGGSTRHWGLLFARPETIACLR
ncbi:hypothetical protein DXV65_20275 [Pseudomonas fluorescens]|nr:hypothetical protein DXV65_20275 [Pseudomonas fluorescens]